MKEILGFLWELQRNNNREWFHANKPRYDEVKRRIDDLAMRLIAAVAAVDPEAAMLTPRDCTYRIYRDTRFSNDKTPYKTHIGIFINPPGGKKSLTCGYYLHLEPGKSFFAAGTICLPSPVIRAIRRSIYDNVDEYRSIVEDPQFTALFPRVGENPVKTAPQGFPKDWEYIGLIRPRDVPLRPLHELYHRGFHLNVPYAACHVGIKIVNHSGCHGNYGYICHR